MTGLSSMHQTVALSLTAFVSLMVGGTGGYAYTNSIHAGKFADLTDQIATLQTKVDEYEAAARPEAPSGEEALSAIRKLIFFGGVKKGGHRTVQVGCHCSRRGLLPHNHGQARPCPAQGAALCQNRRRLGITELMKKGENP
jgi:hypothetical protein